MQKRSHFLSSAKQIFSESPPFLGNHSHRLEVFGELSRILGNQYQRLVVFMELSRNIEFQYQILEVFGELPRILDDPCLPHTSLYNLDHFVVVFVSIRSEVSQMLCNLCNVRTFPQQCLIIRSMKLTIFGRFVYYVKCTFDHHSIRIEYL